VEIELQKVLVHDDDVWVRAQMLREQWDESAVYLDRDDARGTSRYFLGERADPRADLDYCIFGGELGGRCDLSHNILVNEEVLAQALLQANLMLSQHIANIRWACQRRHVSASASKSLRARRA
jgi:hypothetical protein